MKTIRILGAAFAAVALASAAHAGVGSSSTSSASTQSSSGASNVGDTQSITTNSISNFPKDSSVSTVPAMVAPALVGSLTGCIGSTSGGVSVLGFGGSIGTTKTDEACERRAYADFLLTQLHDKDTAIQLICQDPIVRAAYAKTQPTLCR